jgi:deoxyribose-phosphate aldolase
VTGAVTPGEGRGAVLDAARFAAMVDHTLLAPEATADDVVALCAEARSLGVAAVCVSPSLVAVAAAELAGSGIGLAAVCGFPSGAHLPRLKASEAVLAVEAGATEIDMVIDLGAALAGDWRAVEAGIESVRAAVPPPTVCKVILETARLDRAGVVAGCRAAEAAGADFVKTSTGFHPSGGATMAAVELMAATVGDRLGVKASGGLRTAEAAVAMVTAGATRLGMSRTAAVLAELREAERREAGS